ncbi:MAG TPA: hypothetical protein VI997_02170 [Candidatus Thermoplasmatota archaeon]|nr:hypothetical protein [Candidatus Thermoplasmatota archaeon]
MKAWTLVVALATLPLAGCFGGDDEAATEDDLSLSADDPATDDVRPLGNATLNGTATKPSDKSGGHLPHVHNYWGDETRKVLFDEDIDVGIFDGTTFNSLLGRKSASIGGTMWELPEGATVYEGTGELVITATWTDPTITGLALAYRSADKGTSGRWDHEGYTDPQPLASGTPLSIPIAPEMTDRPHEAVSRWGFEFSAAGSPSAAQGIVRLTVEIVRLRDVMAFPGHPITYKDTASYQLADKDFAYKSPSWLTEVQAYVADQKPSEPVTPDLPVPMETHALVVHIDLTGTSTSAPLARQTGLELSYRTAGGTRGHAILLNKTADAYSFGVWVGESDVDSPYTEVSQWEFYPRAGQRVAIPGVRGFQCGGCFDAEVQGHILVTAYQVDPTGKIVEPDEIDWDDA